MPEPTPSEIPSAIGSMPAVLTPGAVVPAPDFGFPSEVEDIVSPVKKRRFGPAAILAMATPALTSIASKNAAENEQGRAMGVLQSGASLARAIGPTIGGILLNNSLNKVDR